MSDEPAGARASLSSVARVKRRGARSKTSTRPDPAAAEAARIEAAARATLAEKFTQFCYNLVGERLDRKERAELADRLKSAGLNFTPGAFYSLLLISSAAATVAGLVLGTLLFLLVVGTSAWPIWALGLGALAGAATAGVFPFVLSNRISNRKNQLEKELPFTLSEMSVMASIGMSPINLIRKMAQRKHDATLTAEFRKVVFMVDLQGKDLVTALTETAKESPSKALRDAMWDLANMIHQGGSLDAYLRGRSDEVMEAKRSGQEAFIDRLSVLSDIYITVVLMGIMFLSIGAFLMDAFHMTAGPLSAKDLLAVLAFGFVPLVTFALAVVLATAHGKAE